MNPIQPGSVSRHSHVRIVAPARACEPQTLRACEDALKHYGFAVSFGEHVFDRDGSPLDLAGRDVDRARDLMTALTDPQVDWVLAARGGYGSMRLLPYVDWNVLSLSPVKPLVGFSDVTALHLALARIGWPTIHGPNADHDWWGSDGEAVVRWLVHGELMLPETPLIPLTQGPRHFMPMMPWRGGNLSLIAALCGTAFEPAWDNTILYLEEVHEVAYRIDRLLQQLRLSGILSRVQGIVFGDAVFDGEDETKVVQNLVGQMAQELGIPAWWGLLSGHRLPMRALPLGVPLMIGTDNRVHLPQGATS